MDSLMHTSPLQEREDITPRLLILDRITKLIVESSVPIMLEMLREMQLTIITRMRDNLF
jgi:hypothetical protein